MRMIDPLFRVAAYCRVSTEKEDQLNSLETQRSFFERYIQERAGWTLAGIFADEGLSGTSTFRRSQFVRMVQLARNGEIDLILTKEVSRFARNTVDTLQITRQLKRCGVGVVFLNDGIDTRENDGEFRLTIMASVAQEESHKISQRTRWGQMQAMKRGGVFGNNALYGYDLHRGVLTVNREQAAVVRSVYHKYLVERKGTYVIAGELTRAGIDSPMRPGEAWSSAAVLRILTNEKYTGVLLQGKSCTADHLAHKRIANPGEQIRIEDHHAAIIQKDLFDQVQAELASRRGQAEERSRYSSRYWYSGKVRRSCRGRSFTVKTDRRRGGQVYRRFVCRGSIPSLLKPEETRCTMGSVNGSHIEMAARAVLEQLSLDREALMEDILSQLQALRRGQEPSDREAQSLQQSIQRQQQRRARALEAYLDGLISKEDWQGQAARCDAELARLNEQLSQQAALTASLTSAGERYEEIRSLLHEELSGGPCVLDEVIEKIVVYADHLEVAVREFPIGFRVVVDSVGSGTAYRAAVTACVPIPMTGWGRERKEM